MQGGDVEVQEETKGWADLVVTERCEEGSEDAGTDVSEDAGVDTQTEDVQ